MCVCVYAWICHGVSVESFISFNHKDPEKQSQVIRFDGKLLYWLSGPTDPWDPFLLEKLLCNSSYIDKSMELKHLQIINH